MQLSKVDGTFSIKESVANGCYVVSYGFDSPIVNEDGNVEVKKVTKFNVIRKNGSLVCDRWFDVYRISDLGEVIFGVEKVATDYERTLSLYDLKSVGPKMISTEHGQMLIGGDSLEETILEKYKYSYGFINKNGNEVIKPIHDDLEFSTEDTCIAARFDGTLSYGYFDTLDGHQITPIKFQKAYDFKESLGRVKYRRKYAFIDRNKVMTDVKCKAEYGIAPIEGAAGDFVDGKAKVVVGNMSTYYINKEGRITSKPFVMGKRPIVNK